MHQVMRRDEVLKYLSGWQGCVHTLMHETAHQLSPPVKVMRCGAMLCKMDVSSAITSATRFRPYCTSTHRKTPFAIRPPVNSIPAEADQKPFQLCCNIDQNRRITQTFAMTSSPCAGRDALKPRPTKAGKDAKPAERSWPRSRRGRSRERGRSPHPRRQPCSPPLRDARA